MNKERADYWQKDFKVRIDVIIDLAHKTNNATSGIDYDDLAKALDEYVFLDLDFGVMSYWDIRDFKAHTINELFEEVRNANVAYQRDYKLKNILSDGDTI
jgi:hypothetical protein